MTLRLVNRLDAFTLKWSVHLLWAHKSLLERLIANYRLRLWVSEINCQDWRNYRIGSKITILASLAIKVMCHSKLLCQAQHSCFAFKILCASDNLFFSLDPNVVGWNWWNTYISAMHEYKPAESQIQISLALRNSWQRRFMCKFICFANAD